MSDTSANRLPATTDAADTVTLDRRERHLALFIAFLAMLLAIASMIDDDADKTGLAAHLERTNLYGYYQSKNIRSNEALIATQTFEAMGKAEQAKHWRSEYSQHEAGKQKILDEARQQETLWQRAARRGEFYKVGVAFLQIAVVIASAALVSSGSLLVVVSSVLAGLAWVYMLNGLGLFVDWLPTDPAALFDWLGGQTPQMPEKP